MFTNLLPQSFLEFVFSSENGTCLSIPAVILPYGGWKSHEWFLKSCDWHKLTFIIFGTKDFAAIAVVVVQVFWWFFWNRGSSSSSFSSFSSLFLFFFLFSFEACDCAFYTLLEISWIFICKPKLELNFGLLCFLIEKLFREIITWFYAAFTSNFHFKPLTCCSSTSIVILSVSPDDSHSIVVFRFRILYIRNRRIFYS